MPFSRLRPKLERPATLAAEAARSRPRTRWRGPGLSRRAFLMGLPPGALAAGLVAKESEYKLLVAFLLHFAIHARWPAEAFASSTSPLVVGVLGRDPFGPRLDQLFRGEKVEGRSVVVKRYRADENPAGCHLLFVGDLEGDRLGSALKQLEAAPVLTLGAREGFCRAGGMVGFYMEEDRVRFEIHLQRVRSRHLDIHSRLLNLAKIYGEPPRQ